MKGLSLQKKESKWEIKEIILLLLMLINICSIFYLTLSKSVVYFDSDVATSNLLAREQAFTKDMFPKTWIYGQDVWTFFINVPMAFLGIFIKDQLILRSVCVVLYTCVFIVLLYFFSTKVFKNRSWLISIPFLVSFISLDYTAHMYFQAAYLYQTMLLLASFLFLVQSLDENFKINYKNLIIGGCILALSLVNGPRNVGMVLMPLVGAFVLDYCFMHNKDDFSSKIKPDLLKFLKWFGFVMIFSVVGIGIFWYVKNRSIFNTGIIGTTMPGFSEINDVMQEVRNYFASMWEIMGGARSSVPLFSIAGILSGIRFVLSFVVLFVLPILLTVKIKEQPLMVRRFILFSWLVFLVSSVLFIFGKNLGSTRYLLIPLVTQSLSGSYFLYNYCLKKKTIFSFFSVCLAFFTILLSFSNAVLFQRDAKQLAVTKTEELETIKQDLLSRNLSMGYATYWNAYSNATFFNFDVEIASIDSPEGLNAFYWLTTTRYYDMELHDKEQGSFLLFAGAEADSFEKSQDVQARLGPYTEKLEYPELDISIYTYDYNILYRINDRILGTSPTNILENTLFANNIEYSESEGFIVSPGTNFITSRYALHKGTYKLHIELEDWQDEKIFLGISTLENEIIPAQAINSNSYDVEFSLDDSLTTNLYIYLQSTQNTNCTIKSLTLEKIDA